jgi:hypothetical protein
MFILAGIGLNIAATLTGTMIMSSGLVVMISYVWARRNPDTVLAFLGMLQFRAPYLVYFLLFFTIVTGGDVVSEVSGILIGHIYYYFEDVYPLMTPSRVRILKTPRILLWLFRQRQPAPAQALAAAAGPAAPRQPDQGVFQRNMMRMAQLRQRGALGSAAAPNSSEGGNAAVEGAAEASTSGSTVTAAPDASGSSSNTSSNANANAASVAVEAVGSANSNADGNAAGAGTGDVAGADVGASAGAVSDPDAGAEDWSSDGWSSLPKADLYGSGGAGVGGDEEALLQRRRAAGDSVGDSAGAGD